MPILDREKNATMVFRTKFLSYWVRDFTCIASVLKKGNCLDKKTQLPIFQ